MLCHLFQPPGHRACGLRLPVAAVHRPHGCARESRHPRRTMKLGTAETKWRAYAVAMSAACRMDRIFAPAEFIGNTLPAKEQQTRMRIRMIADLMIAGCNLSHEVRIGSHVFPEDEKRRGNLMLLQQRKEVRCHLGIRAIVKRERASARHIP